MDTVKFVSEMPIGMSFKKNFKKINGHGGGHDRNTWRTREWQKRNFFITWIRAKSLIPHGCKSAIKKFSLCLSPLISVRVAPSTTLSSSPLPLTKFCPLCPLVPSPNKPRPFPSPSSASANHQSPFSHLSLPSLLLLRLLPTIEVLSPSSCHPLHFAFTSDEPYLLWPVLAPSLLASLSLSTSRLCLPQLPLFCSLVLLQDPLVNPIAAYHYSLPHLSPPAWQLLPPTRQLTPPTAANIISSLYISLFD